jgi:glycerol-3-phosphate acyltransferase PlsY
MAYLIVIGGYLLGSILPADLVVRAIRGRTPEALGDSPGAAGAWRQAGWRAGVLVAVLDALKGAVPLAVAQLLDLGPGGSWVQAAHSKNAREISAIRPVA